MHIGREIAGGGYGSFSGHAQQVGHIAIAQRQVGANGRIGHWSPFPQFDRCVEVALQGVAGKQAIRVRRAGRRSSQVEGDPSNARCSTAKLVSDTFPVMREPPRYRSTCA